MSKYAVQEGDGEQLVKQFCEVLSAEIRCSSISDLTAMAQAYLEAAKGSTRNDVGGHQLRKGRVITLVNIEESFESGKPDRDGMRNLRLFFFFKDDPNKHIMRVKLTHKKMSEVDDLDQVLHRLSERAGQVLSRLGFSPFADLPQREDVEGREQRGDFIMKVEEITLPT